MAEEIFNMKVEGKTLSVEFFKYIGYKESTEILKEFEKIRQKGQIDEVVFFMNNIKRISSAGVRTLIYPKTKKFFGSETVIYLIETEDNVIETLKVCGVDEMFIIRDKYLK